MPRPRRYEISALDPYDPHGIQRRILWVEQGQIDFMTRGPLRERFFRLQNVKIVVDSPSAVFEGWERDGQSKGLCYVGRPDSDFRFDGIQLPRPPGMIFAVFATQSGKISDWRWEPCDQEDPDLPIDHQNRFGRLIWPTTARQT
jgi:hypothetical protein